MGVPLVAAAPNAAFAAIPSRRTDWTRTEKRSGAAVAERRTAEGALFCLAMQSRQLSRRASLGVARPAAENSRLQPLRGRAVRRLLIAL